MRSCSRNTRWSISGDGGAAEAAEAAEGEDGWTIKDGVLYDAQALLREAGWYVQQEKQRVGRVARVPEPER